MRHLELSLILTQLAEDKHIKSYNVAMSPIMASATTTDGKVLATIKNIREYYCEIYCK